MVQTLYRFLVKEICGKEGAYSRDYKGFQDVVATTLEGLNILNPLYQLIHTCICMYM
jgi:hypothetical protein